MIYDHLFNNLKMCAILSWRAAGRQQSDVDVMGSGFSVQMRKTALQAYTRGRGDSDHQGSELL